MEEQTTNEQTTAEDQGGDEGRSKDERRREALSRRAKTAEAQVRDLTSQLEELRNELDTKSGSLDSIVDRKDKRIKSLEDQVSELEGRWVKQETDGRRDALARSIAEKHGVPVARIKGLLAEKKGNDEDFDDAPEVLSESVIKSTIKALLPLDKDTFSTKDTSETGRTRPRPSPAPREYAAGLQREEQGPMSDFERNVRETTNAPPPGRYL